MEQNEEITPFLKEAQIRSSSLSANKFTAIALLQK
jgi:hypothetical protein